MRHFCEFISFIVAVAFFISHLPINGRTSQFLRFSAEGTASPKPIQIARNGLIIGGEKRSIA